MPSDFADAGKRLKAGIPIPDLSLTSIRERSRAHEKRVRMRVAALSVVALAVIVSGTSLAERIFGIRVWVSGNNVALTMQSVTTISDPNVSEFRHVMSSAAFPVTLPVGLPPHEHIIRLIYYPTDHPSVVVVVYRDEKSRVLRQFVAAESSAVEHGLLPALPGGQMPMTHDIPHWQVGHETVLFIDKSLRDRGASIENAMSRVTPSQSLAATLPMIYRIVVVGDGSYEVAAAANALAPESGHTTLIDAETLRGVGSLAAAGKALMRRRIVTVDNIKTVRGHADFSAARSHWSTEEALSANGVRAVRDLLASDACGRGPKFNCEVLVNEREGEPFRLWTFSTATHEVTARYVVDRNTGRVVKQ